MLRHPLVPIRVWNRDKRVQTNREQCPTRPGRPPGRTNRDEDIPTTNTSPVRHEEQVDSTKKKDDEIRIRPITRARAKLIEQQVNSLLIDSDILCNENFILPKSLYVCIIRYNDE